MWDLALKDTREAVLAFYSAWDNFVAHTVDIVLDEFGVTASMPSSTKRAEPRHGAFVALFLAKTKQTLPTVPSSGTARMRNSVIHDDKIPTEDEALKVGEDVQRCILACQGALPGLHEEYARGAKSVARIQRLLAAAKLSAADMTGVSTTIRMSEIPADLRARVDGIRKGLSPSPARNG